MRPKKTPMRMCLGCGEMKPKKELVRVVRSPQKEGDQAPPQISLDPSGKKPGRGAYLCRDAQCLRKARKSRRLERAFSCGIPDEVYGRMEEEIEEARQAAQREALAQSAPRDEKGRPILVIEDEEEARPHRKGGGGGG